VYCQNDYIDPPKKKYEYMDRSGVNPRDLANKFNLGNPEACNFFYLATLETHPKDNPIMKHIVNLNQFFGNRDIFPLG